MAELWLAGLVWSGLVWSGLVDSRDAKAIGEAILTSCAAGQRLFGAWRAGQMHGRFSRNEIRLLDLLLDRICAQSNLDALLALGQRGHVV